MSCSIYCSLVMDIENQWENQEKLETPSGRSYLYQYRDEEDNSNYALVKVNKPLETCYDQKSFLGQLAAHSILHHPCIIELKGFYLPTPLVDYMKEQHPLENGACAYEYVECQPLSKIIFQSTLNNTQKAKIAYGIAHGMKYIHNKKLIHRQLTPENIMITNEDLEPKISNFSKSKEVTNDLNQTANFANTVDVTYCAPEQLTGDKYTNTVDIYSYALVLYQLYTGQKLKQYSAKERMSQLLKNNFLYPEIPEDMPHDLALLIQNCWDIEPTRRIPFEYITQCFENTAIFPETDMTEIARYARYMEENVKTMNPEMPPEDKVFEFTDLESREEFDKEKESFHLKYFTNKEQLTKDREFVQSQKEIIEKEKQYLKEEQAELESLKKKLADVGGLHKESTKSPVTPPKQAVSRPEPAKQQPMQPTPVVAQPVQQKPASNGSNQAPKPSPSVPDQPQAPPKNLDPTKMTLKEKIAYYQCQNK